MRIKKAFFSLTLMSIPVGLYSVGCGGVPATWQGSGGDGSSWNQIANWNPNTCFPDGPTDIASFDGTSTTTNIDQNAGPISLQEISFSTRNFNVGAATSSDTVTFSNIASLFTITGGTSVTEHIIFPVIITSPAAATIKINPSGLLGTLNFDADVTLTNASLSIPNQGGRTVVKFNQNLTLNSSSFSATNALNRLLNSTPANTIQIAKPLTVGAGSQISNSNTGNLSGAVTGGAQGSGIFFADALTINGGTGQNQNTGSVSTGTSTQASIAVALFTDSLNIITGSFSNINTGPISGVSATTGNLGAFLEFNSLNSAGSFSQTNSGPITNGGTGVATDTFGTINITGGSVNFQNQGPGTVTDGDGSILFCLGTLNQSAGAFSQSNSGNITSSTQRSTGCTAVILNMNITGGTLTNSNAGAIVGTPTNSSAGSLIEANTLTISGNGVVTNSASTNSVDANSFGDLIQAALSINVNGSGTLISNNNPTNGFRDMVQSPAINVGTGGTLSGTGLYSGISNIPTTLQNTTVTNSGRVEPFDGVSTPGTLTINGNYQQTSAGTLQVDLFNATTFSQLNVTGSAGTTTKLNGTLLVNFLPLNTVQATDTFVLVQTGPNNTLSGAFNTTLFDNLPTGFLPHISYTFGPNGEVILSFTEGSIPTPFIPTIARYAGGFLETLLSDINHINSHLGLRMEDLRRRFSTPRTEQTKTAKAPTTARIAKHLVAASDLNFLAVNPQTREEQEHLRREVVKTEQERPWNFYFGPTGRADGVVRTKEDQPGLNYWSAGALTGFDYAFAHWGIGFMADYERITARAKQHWGKIKVDEIHASIYSTYAPACLPELALNGIVGGAYELYSIRRSTGLPGDKLVAKGKPKGAAFDALFGLEYAFANRQFSGMPSGFEIIPMANVQYIYLRASDYTEHGAGPFDLKVGSQRIKSLRSGLGLRVNYNLQRGNFGFVPELYGEWQREYLNKNRHIHFMPSHVTTAGQTLVLPGTGRNIALAGLDLLFTYKRFGLEANYEFEYNSLYHDHFFYAGANVRF